MSPTKLTRRGSTVAKQAPAHKIGEGAIYKGDLTFSGLLRVEGVYEGTLKGTGAGPASVYVTRTGVLKAEVKDMDLVRVDGKIEGDISAMCIILKKDAVVQGNINCVNLVVDPSVAMGTSNISTSPTNKAQSEPAPQESKGVCPHMAAAAGASEAGTNEEERAEPSLSEASLAKKALTPEFEAVALLLSFDDESFEGHLKHEYAAENLWFWKRAVKFRSANSSDELRTQAKVIYDEFCKEDSATMINISSGVLEAIKAKVESPEEILQPDCFDTALKEVEVIMSYGPFPRFADQIISNIETSWDQVLAAVSFADAGELFYSILFEMAPSVKSLFSRSKRAQGEMLMSMVDSAIKLLNNLEALVPVLVDLGVRHKDYGAKAAHYDTVGQALVETLSRALGDKFTPSIKDSWIVVYTLISNIMISTLDKEDEINAENIVTLPPKRKSLLSPVNLINKVKLWSTITPRRASTEKLQQQAGAGA
ncbi:unnamed protein product [Chrysoparadoxa australica]